MKIISVVAARPNFMKIAPFIRAIRKRQETESIEHVLVHTGQHYDSNMSESFFEDLGIPFPDINLGIGSGTHAEQVGKTMMAFEKVLLEEKPDWVVVVGDVNATMACSVTAKKLKMKCCHIEAGLRSRDMNMPEEINRLVTDRLSDLLLTPDELSSENLRKEGSPEKSIVFVGNIMIDTLEANRKKASKLSIPEIVASNKINSVEHDDLENADLAVITMHRPSNVDQQKTLEPLINFITDKVSSDFVVIWPIHPRTRNRLETFGLWEKVINTRNLIITEPVGYLEMLRLNMGAKLMLTDSGGLQEECTVLGTPCLTLRWNTERPITLKEYGGVSVLVGNDINLISKEYQVFRDNPEAPFKPEKWDGKTSDRILDAILEYKA